MNSIGSHRENDFHFTYRSDNSPSVLTTSPSPEITAIRSLPLNHFTECSSPQVFASTGHVSVIVWPRRADTVSSENRKNDDDDDKIYFRSIIML
jgi:hypothetical protein